MLYVVTGGSGSGKSACAESLAVKLYRELPECGTLRYIATMYPYEDAETEERIVRHRRQREGKGFATTECYTDISALHAEKGDVILLECMSNLLANEMYLDAGRIKDGCVCVPRVSGVKEQTAVLRLCRMAEQMLVAPICGLAEQAGHVVVVTNEIFSDGAEAQYDLSVRQYVNVLGYVNRRLTGQAARAVEVVCGIPVDIRRENRGK